MIFDKKELTRWVIIGVIIIVIFWEIKRWIRQQSPSDIAKQKELDTMAINTKNLSYKDPSVYQSIGNQIENGLSVFSLPSSKVNMFTAITMIKTLDDLKKVIQLFGIRNGETLTDKIRDSFERTDINNNLKHLDIPYAF